MDQLLGLRVEHARAFLNVFNFKKQAEEREIGVEFEVEGKGLPAQEDILYHWKVEHDGSLRGESAEYVMRAPEPFDKFEDKVFPHLTKSFKKFKGKANFSGRCSTHVHVNVQNMFFYQVVLYGMMYYLFEHITPAFTGEEREGNLFCVGASESSFISNASMGRAIGNDMYALLNSRYRYSSVNFSALKKYGSLEFRAMKGTFEPDEVYPWIEYLLRLRDYSLKIKPKDIPEILGQMSRQTPAAFLTEILGQGRVLEKIRAYFQTDHVINEAIYKGIDTIQHCFYEHDWGSLYLFPDEIPTMEDFVGHVLLLERQNKNCMAIIKSMGVAMYSYYTDKRKGIIGPVKKGKAAAGIIIDDLNAFLDVAERGRARHDLADFDDD